jgi:hypothetical protein
MKARTEFERHYQATQAQNKDSLTKEINSRTEHT